jgi:pimeloyl-ACP methyl ester carboxylesterase
MFLENFLALLNQGMKTQSCLNTPQLPTSVGQLTERDSIEFARQIQQVEITTPLLDRTIKTSYVCQGTSGIPIVFLHGFDSSIFEFRRIIPLIAAKQIAWSIDLLGFGFTERLPNCPFSPASIDTHLYATWQTLIQQPMILVGVSMGGAAAIEFTLAHPESVHKLILIDSAGYTQPPMIGKFLVPPLGYLATKFLANPNVRRSVSEKAYYDQSFVTDDSLLCAALHLEMPRWSEALIAFTRSGGYGYVIDRLPEIKQEALILWGDHDQILGTEPAQQFVNNLPNSYLQWMPNCGHVPHLEMAQITATAILEWQSKSCS